MPQPGDDAQVLLSAAPSRPFLLRHPGEPAEPVIAAEPVVPAEPIATASPRLPRLDPFEVRLSGKLLRAQLRGTLPARHR